MPQRSRSMFFHRSRKATLSALAAAVLAAAPASAMAQPRKKPAPKPAPAPAPAAPAAPPLPTPTISPAPVDAGPPADAPPITLPEALQLAVKQSPDLASATIDIEIAQAQILQAAGLDDWLVAAGLNFIHTGEDYTGPDRSLSATATADFTRNFASGGTLTLHGELALTNIDGESVAACFPDAAPCSGTTYKADVSAAYNQPLLKGRGAQYARAAQAQAAIARDAAALARSSAALTVVRDVVLAYWDLVFAWQDLAIRKSSLTLAQERLRITKAGIEQGGVAPTEALAVEQIIATREEEIIASELNIAQQSIQLRGLLQLEVGPSAIDLWAEAPMSAEPKSVELGAVLTRAFATNPQLAQLAVQEKGATIEVEVTDNGLLPQLDFSISAEPTGVGDDPGEAASEMVQGQSFTAVAGLNLSYALGRRAASGAHRLARAQREKVRVNTISVRTQIATALVTAVRTLQSAEQRIGLADRAIDLAQKNIVAEQSRFGLGKSTNFDVLQRQDELKQAQLRRARAIVDFHKANAAIASLTGDLLVDYGIRLDQRE